MKKAEFSFISFWTETFEDGEHIYYWNDINDY